MKPEDITVRGRHRKDYGDIDGLAASIDDIGLLNPIVVDGEGRLVAGGRRLAACLHLGWDDIPVIVAMNLTEAAAALRAERDENTQRKDFLPSEIASIGRALEEVYKPEAEARIAEGRQKGADATAGRLVAPGSHKPQRVREQVGEALGVGGATYDRIKSLANDADDQALPDERRAAAATAIAELDAGAPVRATYQRYREEHTLQQTADHGADEAPAAKRASAVPSAQTERGQILRRAHARRIEETVARLRGLMDAISSIELIVPTAVDAMDGEDIDFAIRVVADTSASLTRLRRRLITEQTKRTNA